MRVYLRAALIATTAVGVGDVALAQSSSNPFSKISGWFSGDSDAESPVSLSFQVEGHEDLERTLANSSLIQGALNENRSTGQDILAAARADYARILGALYDEGFYSALIYIKLDGVEAAEIAPLDAPHVVRNVVVQVDTGPRFRFSRAELAPVAPDSDIPQDYRRGEIAGTGTIKSAARAAVEGWRNYGYAKADVSSQDIVADHIQNSVDSRIGVTPGPVVTFGKLNTQGNQRLRTARLVKIAGLPEGERFDPEEIEDVRKRLRRSGVFSAITLEEADQLGPDNSMDVNLTVVEQKPRRIGAGFEISTNDGSQFSAYWMHRNLLGGGERLRIDGEVRDVGSDTSGRDDELTVRLDRPATITPDTTAFIEASVARLREEDYDSDNASVGIGFNHIFSDRFTLDFGVNYEFSRVYDDLGETDFKVLAFPFSVLWDRRDNEKDPRHGYYLVGDLRPFKGFDDTGSGAVVEGEARAYYSLGEEDRFTLAGRARAGSVLGSDIQDTPRDYLFFSGGGGTVRGQPYESLGVEEIMGPNGPIKTGGMSEAIFSAEFRWQVREKIGLVAFTDYGKLWTESSWSGNTDWHSGAGVGVRYSTPIGPLRFDIATPTGGDTGEGVQLYIGLGQAF
ncbi:autotransporter assembly complex protein TamA [Paracoccus fistulariae]|uniref:Outer membrane protein assembly factor n=1 Tax=Paracoccus fistulariae TaxID=658446 RepID=A0ABY7SHE9_9RHOB|nr:autotransporter assembly complex family protein [Paracoccus fistulariae]MDB6180940.1 autotransporter assembly complex protein TamA [Paracoccus fistulariae]WCR06236.1 outer membrane protein assembly factor [Paracoccus fistulariae]